jgi:DNA-binding PadR family transcriptional regulator
MAKATVTSDTFHGNLWALTVLCFLRERPMHPYEIRKLVKLRRNDAFLDLKAGSLYHAIAHLEAAGLVKPIQTSREGRRPERTTYQITAAGLGELQSWLCRLLATPPSRTQSPFFAAISYLTHLEPADAAVQLRSRVQQLSAEIAQADASIQHVRGVLPRVLLLETEYAQAMRRAEAAWVTSVLQEISAGRLAWNPELLLAQAAASVPTPVPARPGKV